MTENTSVSIIDEQVQQVNVPDVETYVHIYTVRDDTIVELSACNKAVFIPLDKEGKHVPGIVSLYVRDKTNQRDVQIRVAVYRVTDESTGDIPEGNWEGEYTLTTGQQLVTSFFSGRVIDSVSRVRHEVFIPNKSDIPEVILTAKDPYKNTSDIRWTVQAKKFSVYPGHPYVELSTPLRQNIAGVESCIHETTVPAGYTINFGELRFVPRDVEGRRISGELIIEARDMLGRPTGIRPLRVYLQTAEVFDGFNVCLKPFFHVRTIFKSEEVLDPDKTIFEWICVLEEAR